MAEVQDTNGEHTPPPRPRTMTMSGELTAAAETAGASSSDATVELVKILRDLRNGNGNGGSGGGKKFLGLSGGDWTKMIIAWSIATVVFVMTWYRTVNHGLDARPTHDMVEVKISDTIEKHSVAPHPAAARRLKVLEGEQRIIRESQIRAEEVGKQQTEVLREIKGDIKLIRRRSR